MNAPGWAFGPHPPTLPGAGQRWWGASYWRAESTTWQTGPFWRERLKKWGGEATRVPSTSTHREGSPDWTSQSHKGPATLNPKSELAAHEGVFSRGDEWRVLAGDFQTRQIPSSSAPPTTIPRPSQLQISYGCPKPKFCRSELRLRLSLSGLRSCLTI